MPVLRYFLFVGGVLLALLLVANVVLPKPAADDDTLASAVDMPVIRIHSEQKLPQPLVFDTNAPMFRQTTVAAQAASPVSAPVVAAADKVSAKARVREAFAQLPPEDEASQPKAGEMAKVDLPEPKMYPAKPQKRRIARARPARPLMQVAQQPRFGFFETW